MTDPKNVTLRFRCTEEEASAFRKAAEEKGVGLSEYIRSFLRSVEGMTMDEINWNDCHDPNWRRIVEFATTRDKAPSTIASTVHGDGSDIERHWAFTRDHGKTVERRLTTNHVLDYIDLSDATWFCED